MSFSVSFCASSISLARQKMSEAHAPAAVKALIEKCLDALSHPLPSGVTQSGIVHGQEKASRPPRLIGVHVEAWGHVGDPGDHGKSWIDRFVVQPLFE